MWYWLRKNTHEPYVRWLHLAGIIFFFHLVVVLILFFVYRDTVSHLTLTITRNIRRTIEFRIAVETIKKPSSSAVTTVPVPKKASVVKAPSIQKKATVAQASPKKEIQKKQISVPQEKKASVPPEAPKPIAAPVAELPAEHLAMDVTANKDIVQDTGMQDYTALYNAIVARWAPPPGIPAHVKCTITIALDRQGAITALEINNSSGMLIYDLAAEAAMNEIHFPRLAWGKSITITFSM